MSKRALHFKLPAVLLIWIFSGILFLSSTPKKEKETLPLIPFPQEVKIHTGNFLPDEHTIIYYNDTTLISLAEEIPGIYQRMLLTKAASNENCFELILDKQIKEAETYQLKIGKKNIVIRASSKEGIYRGIQTLRQLMIAEGGQIRVRCCVIDDNPAFMWRGMHLDCCRHFFTKGEVKRYIDLMALYKFNVFHWHLTEDQGWRIEIKKYPLLTTIGSMRKETIIGKQSDTASYDGKQYGGFYTQEDIKEIVDYAAAKYITIVPEIEMPGHSLAALASYPSLSCTGKKFEVGTRWGVWDDVYCAGKDSTFLFLQNVLDEVCALFPGKYIHIGGDECPKERWKNCAECQKRIKEEHLKDENELQSYFIRRMEKYLNSKGKQIIGWDEILEGGLAPNAAVMSWRGTEGGIAAAKQKHYVVMSPGKPCYFDHYQSKDKQKEPLAIGGFNPLIDVYNYNPIPEMLHEEERSYIMGAQGNVWTEYIPNFRQVTYMSVPRMCALSEVVWTNSKKKDYSDFVNRLTSHSKVLDAMGIYYAPHFKRDEK